ncbi:DbpA RNA binding domain-containing protein, partial [Patulibacter sp.]|uniref:DbpA RNA binding domain-containing protein n=1 Tax=Patulibacter sp. TaxID=1912859 RepID=UPI00271B8D4A
DAPAPAEVEESAPVAMDERTDAVEAADAGDVPVAGTDEADEPRRRAKPRRGRKPQLNRDADEVGTRIVLVPGSADGVAIRDVVEAITSSSGLDGEAVRGVSVLENFALATVPAAGVADTVEAVNAAGGRVRAEVLLAG